jgi:hypothetical protein
MRTTRWAARRNHNMVVMMPMNSMVTPGTYSTPMTAMAMPMATTGGVVQAQATTPASPPTPMNTPMTSGTPPVVGTTAMPCDSTSMASTTSTGRRHLFPRLFSRRY